MDVRLWGRIIGRCPFTDGFYRDVYEDAEGRQYVWDLDGERVYGQWLPPADEPAVTDASAWQYYAHPSDRNSDMSEFISMLLVTYPADLTATVNEPDVPLMETVT
jgi:hypothetical protein